MDTFLSYTWISVLKLEFENLFAFVTNNKLIKRAGVIDIMQAQDSQDLLKNMFL